MPVILSLSKSNDEAWIAAGPEGLFRYADETLSPIVQPQEQLRCTVQLGDTLFVGGAPHGVALSPDTGTTWHPGLIKHDDAPIVAIAPDPDWSASGVLLAASIGQGIFRSEDRGQRWVSCNFGLHTYTILSIAWTQPLPRNAYPRWEIVFAGGDDGIYRSPNAGLGWKRCNGEPQSTQIIVPDCDFHQTGLALAGTESDGLWRSDDGGYSFYHVANTPDCINALIQTENGWILSDDEGLHHSIDGNTWRAIPESDPVLILSEANSNILAGDDEGIHKITIPELI